jgi:hypothetical protein
VPKTLGLAVTGLFDQKYGKLSHNPERRTQSLQSRSQTADVGTRLQLVQRRLHEINLLAIGSALQRQNAGPKRTVKQAKANTKILTSPAARRLGRQRQLA